jgi:hypothetical protein
MPVPKFATLAERGDLEMRMIPAPEEADFFAAPGVPCWPPEQRTEHRLM